jgi:hypothetical protein
MPVSLTPVANGKNVQSEKFLLFFGHLFFGTRVNILRPLPLPGVRIPILFQLFATGSLTPVAKLIPVVYLELLISPCIFKTNLK